jgi:hypothetical protein
MSNSVLFYMLSFSLSCFWWRRDKDVVSSVIELNKHEWITLFAYEYQKRLLLYGFIYSVKKIM